MSVAVTPSLSSAQGPPPSSTAQNGPAASKPSDALILAYFKGIRGRIEPLLYLLEDAAADYTLQEVPGAEWPALKADREKSPWAALPTLRVSIAHDGRYNYISEVGTIMRYLAATLKAPEMSPYGVPIATARHDMIETATFSFMQEWRRVWFQPDCLSPDSLASTWQKLIEPYLTCLTYHLSSDIYPPLLMHPPLDSRPGTNLVGAAAAAAYVVDLITDAYSESFVLSRFPACIELRDGVLQRPRIAAWLAKSARRKLPRTFGDANKVEHVREAAERIAKGELQIEDPQHRRAGSSSAQ